MNGLSGLAIAAMCVMAFESAAYAQTASGPADAAPSPNLHTCNYPFGSGSLVWCVSTEGNLVSMISPAGNQNLNSNEGNNEGYVLCTPTGTYYGLGWGSGGFGAPTLVSLTAASVTIARTTTDGRYTLTQKFSRDTVERDVTLQMKLKNNGPAASNIYLARFAEISVDNDFGDDRFDASVDSLWARDGRAFSASPRLGAVSHTSWIGDMGFACDAVDPPAVPGGPGLAMFSNRFNVGTMGAVATKTVYLAYRSH